MYKFKILEILNKFLKINIYFYICLILFNFFIIIRNGILYNYKMEDHYNSIFSYYKRVITSTSHIFGKYCFNYMINNMTDKKMWFFLNRFIFIGLVQIDGDGISIFCAIGFSWSDVLRDLFTFGVREYLGKQLKILSRKIWLSKAKFILYID